MGPWRSPVSELPEKLHRKMDGPETRPWRTVSDPYYHSRADRPAGQRDPGSIWGHCAASRIPRAVPFDVFISLFVQHGWFSGTSRATDVFDEERSSPSVRVTYERIRQSCFKQDETDCLRKQYNVLCAILDFIVINIDNLLPVRYDFRRSAILPQCSAAGVGL